MSDTKLFLIKTKAGDFKSFKELQEFCDKQYETLQNALGQIKVLHDENKHLKVLLNSISSSPEDGQISTIVKSPAEYICETQIEALNALALTRLLSLDEVKKLDLLIKNHRLLKGDSTGSIDVKEPNKKINKLPKENIVALAKIKSEE